MNNLENLFPTQNGGLKIVSNQCVIVKEFVEQKIGFDNIHQILQTLARDCVQSNVRNLIDLSILGYGSDSRELHEIPEVCEYARLLHKNVPALFSFLDLPSVKRFVGWQCGPMAVSEVETPPFRERYKQQLKYCLDSWKCGNDLFEKAGASSGFLQDIGNADFQRLCTLSIMVIKGGNPASSASSITSSVQSSSRDTKSQKVASQEPKVKKESTIVHTNTNGISQEKTTVGEENSSKMKKYSFIALAALFCITIYCYVVYQKKSNTTVIEGTIKRTMIIGFTSNRNQMQADPPSEQLIASDGTTYTLRQMPNCIVNDKTSDPDVIQLGAVGKYRCKGNLNGKVFEAYEITRLD